MSNCNCNGNTYNIGMGCCQPVLGPVENYYTKYQIDRMLEKIDSGCCITEEEVDEKIASAKTDVEAEIPSLDGYATEQWVLEKHYITGVDLSDYALKSEIPTVPTSNSAFTNDMGYLTEHQHIKTINGESLIGDGNIEIGSGGTPITIDSTLDSGSTNPVANSAITIAIGNKLDASAYTPTDLSNYYTKNETNSAITSAVTDMATQTWVNNQGFLKEHQSLSAYSTTNEVNTMIANATSGLQETLIAGTNITISGNTISANCCPTIWCGDYTQWASVSGNPDSNTIYLVHE